MIVDDVTGGQPDYRCQVPAGVLINDTLPAAADNGSFLQCEMYVGNNETERCSNWEYFGDVGNTIVSQVKTSTCGHVSVGTRVQSRMSMSSAG